MSIRKSPKTNRSNKTTDQTSLIPKNVRPFTPESTQTQGPEVQAQTETNSVEASEHQDHSANKQQTGFHFSNISLFAAGTTPPPPPTINRFVQAKLTIGQPNDKYEKEADQVAHQVVQQINNPSVQQQTNPEETDLKAKPIQMKPLTVQRQGGGIGNAASSELERDIQQASGSGQGLDTSIRQPMEQAMGADFSGVKIHADSKADQMSQSIQAKAFTTGNDIFFKKGEYNPSSRGGQELLAHELTHVVQQTGTVARVIQRKPKQQCSNIRDLMLEAQDTKKNFDSVVKTLKTETHAKQAITADLKDPGRVLEKARAKNEADAAAQAEADHRDDADQGAAAGAAAAATVAQVPDNEVDVSGILDIVRGTLIYRNLYGLLKGMEYIEHTNWYTPGETRAKDLYFLGNEMGYRDIKYNLVIGRHITELQLNTESMNEAKKYGHTLYDLVRSDTPIANIKAKGQEKVDKAIGRLEHIRDNMGLSKFDKKTIVKAIGLINGFDANQEEPADNLKHTLKRIGQQIYGGAWQNMMSEAKDVKVQNQNGGLGPWLDQGAGDLEVLPRRRAEIVSLAESNMSLTDISKEIGVYNSKEPAQQLEVEKKIQAVIDWHQEQKDLGMA